MRHQPSKSSLRRILRNLFIGCLLIGGGASALLAGSGCEACIGDKSCAESAVTGSVACAGIVP
jgi:hypothetical protein